MKGMKICFFQLVVENASLDLEDRSTQTLDLPRWRRNNLTLLQIGPVNIICVNGCVMIRDNCRKKKGTQSEAITLAEKLAQASNIDIFESTSQAFQDSGC